MKIIETRIFGDKKLNLVEGYAYNFGLCTFCYFYDSTQDWSNTKIIGMTGLCLLPPKTPKAHRCHAKAIWIPDSAIPIIEKQTGEQLEN